MRFKAIYAAEFYGDLQENVNWYNEKQAGLGRRFYKAVKEQTAWIKKNPFTIAVRYDDVRCAKVKGFPFMVHFKVFQEINEGVYYYRSRIDNNLSSDLKLSEQSMERLLYVIFINNPDWEKQSEQNIADKLNNMRGFIEKLRPHSKT